MSGPAQKMREVMGFKTWWYFLVSSVSSESSFQPAGRWWRWWGRGETSIRHLIGMKKNVRMLSWSLCFSLCLMTTVTCGGVYTYAHALRAHFLPLRVLVFRLQLPLLLFFSLLVLNPEVGITHSMPTHEGEQWRRLRVRRLQRWLISKTFRTTEKGRHLAVLF